MISGRFYTSQELQTILGVSRQRVHNLAREQGWAAHKAGILYHADDVTEYLRARWRRELAAEFGVTVNGLVEHDEWDLPECPVCGAFAVWKPARPEEIKNLEIEIYNEGWPWRCIKGHGPEED